MRFTSERLLDVPWYWGAGLHSRMSFGVGWHCKEKTHEEGSDEKNCEESSFQDSMPLGRMGLTTDMGSQQASI